jgi:stress response protein YsnF
MFTLCSDLSLLVQHGGTCCIAAGWAIMDHKTSKSPAVSRPTEGSETIALAAERAVVSKRKKLTGGVRVRTVTRQHEEVVDTPLRTEQVAVERIGLDRWVEEPIPVRQEGDTTIITLHEEVVVVEKRLKAIEEVRLTRQRTTRRVPERITLRREEALVERVDAAADEDEPA